MSNSRGVVQMPNMFQAFIEPAQQNVLYLQFWQHINYIFHLEWVCLHWQDVELKENIFGYSQMSTFNLSYCRSVHTDQSICTGTGVCTHNAHAHAHEIDRKFIKSNPVHEMGLFERFEFRNTLRQHRICSTIRLE